MYSMYHMYNMYVCISIYYIEVPPKERDLIKLIYFSIFFTVAMSVCKDLQHSWFTYQTNQGDCRKTANEQTTGLNHTNRDKHQLMRI
jgi:hypothetical protein